MSSKKHLKDHYPCVIGEKSPREVESPITTFTFLNGCQAVVEKFHECGLSPNDITVLSTIFKLLSIYLVLKRHPILAAVAYLTAYFFDCLDGVSARRYNACTALGDVIDHVSDLFGFIGIMIAIMITYPMNRWWFLLLFFALFGTTMHMGLNEEFIAHCRGVDEPNNVLRVCTYISQWIEPNRVFERNREDEKLLKQYCDKLVERMKITRWNTDVNLVLIVVVYLIVQGLA